MESHQESPQRGTRSRAIGDQPQRRLLDSGGQIWIGGQAAPRRRCAVVEALESHERTAWDRASETLCQPRLAAAQWTGDVVQRPKASEHPAFTTPWPR